MKIAIIGKGRVATHLTQALASAGHDIVMCGGRKRIQAVPADAEVVILSIKDDAIASVASEFANSNALILHTSGSVSIDAIPSEHRGVMYPMQTFSMERAVDFRNIPLFLEASSEEDMNTLSRLAASISDTQMPMSSGQRKTLHLAAVLCCNFVNHLFELSHDVMAEQGIPFKILFPLIEETFAKIHTMTPHEAQTGPALRWDENVMQWHMAMLHDPRHREIYRLLSESIRVTHTRKKCKQ